MNKFEKLMPQCVASQTSWERFETNRRKDWGLAGIDTGIHQLNLAIGGIMPAEVITIAGRSGMGKTALLTPILKASARIAGIKPEFLMFTWEMEASKLVDRMISYDTGLTAKDLIMGARLLTEKNIAEVKDSIESSKEISVHYHQRSADITEVTDTFSEFKEYCDNKTKEDGIERMPVGIIDYVGLAELDGSGVRTYGINDFYRGLKQVANKTDGAWIVLAQISRGADKKEMPDREDLADSQSIENNSDVLAIIHRPEYMGRSVMIDPKTREEIEAKNKMLFRVLKCRQFGPSEFIVACDISKYRFWDINHGQDYPYWELYKDEEFWRQHFGFNKSKFNKVVDKQKDIFEDDG